MSRGLDNLKKWHYYLIILAFSVCAAAWASRNLLDSPRPWFDEGIYLQAAKNIALTGQWGIQTAPQKIISLDFITVGFPLLAPLALLFKLAGPSLLAARLYMLAWIALGVFLTGLAGSKIFNRSAGLWAAALIATFGPWYANGKNVMGEVPGLVLLLAGLWALAQWEGKPRSFGWAGATSLLFSLAAVTKPSFLVVLPALLCAVCLIWQRHRFGFKILFSLFLPGLFVCAAWFKTQFNGWPSAQVLAHYSNPYGLDDVGAAVALNLKNFFLHTTPWHLAVLLSIIAVYLALRRRIRAAELAMAVIIALTLVSYFRTAGWYRYFFVAQVLALFWLPEAVQIIVQKIRPAAKLLMPAVIGLFLCVNIFALWRDPAPMFGTTWRQVKNIIEANPQDTWFFANAPEAAFFYPGTGYGQYLKVTEKLKIGEPQPEFKPSRILMFGDLPELRPSVNGYRPEKSIGDYHIWTRPPVSTVGL